MKNGLNKRNEIDDIYKWDLTKMYKTINNWEADLKQLETLSNQVLGYKGKILNNPSNLLKVLDISHQITRCMSNLFVYANLKYHEDTTNNSSMKIKGKIEKLVTEVEEKNSFIYPEIIKGKWSLIEEFIKKEPQLGIYYFYLEKMFRQKKHILSNKEEKIIASANEILSSSSQIYNVIVNTDINYGYVKINNQKIQITDSNFVKLLNSKEQSTRKMVFKKYYATYHSLKNTFAYNLIYNIKSSFFLSDIRKYKDPLQMSLYNNDINLSIYNNLIKTINNKINIFHKYILLKKQELKVDNLHMYDIYKNLIDSNDEYSYEEAQKLVKKALMPLGSNYISIVEKVFKERVIDVYDNVGKRSGAYSWGTYDSPPYILLNYDGTLNDIATIAHEVGHSIHSYYTNKTQPFVDSGHDIFTAEIASTVNEILLFDYLFKNAKSNDQKKMILNKILEKFKASIYRQTMFAEFEKILFEKEKQKEILTEQLISDIYYQLNQKYYGNEIIHDKEISLEWARIPHFYRPFYVYQYATGMAAACVIADDILKRKAGFLKKYINFLSSGKSNYPLELLKDLGLDMSKTEPIERAIEIFNNYIEEYRKLI